MDEANSQATASFYTSYILNVFMFAVVFNYS